MTATVEQIRQVLLQHDDPTAPPRERRGMHAIGRALVLIADLNNSRRHLTSSRFVIPDWGIGDSMALQYSEHGVLTPKQVKLWQQPNIRGYPRIIKYENYLLAMAHRKEKRIAALRARYLTDQPDLFEDDNEIIARLSKA